MSAAVFNSARQRLQGNDHDNPIEWRAHGAYLFHGLGDPVQIRKAGQEGISFLTQPEDTAKARRAVTAAEEPTLGWRPAVGLAIPHRTHWLIDRKLGEGGYGEIWLARHAKTKEPWVFKFCFHADRVRGLKREVSLFRLLKEELGDRDDIVRILDWQFDEPPACKVGAIED